MLVRILSRVVLFCLEGLEESGEYMVYVNDVKLGYYCDLFNLLGNSCLLFEDNCL